MQKQLNRTQFNQPVDADATKANIYYIKRRFQSDRSNSTVDADSREILPRQEPWPVEDSHQEAILLQGLHHDFPPWICETYLQPLRKKSKNKTVNQYWRDFKMLYCPLKQRGRC